RCCCVVATACGRSSFPKPALTASGVAHTLSLCVHACKSTSVTLPEPEQGSNSCSMSTNAGLAVGLGLGAVLLTLDSGAFHLRWEFTGLRGAAEGIVLCIAAGVTVLALGWLYRLLFCPLELLRTPEEVGYIAEDGRTKARAANEVRRRREAGDLPPVYPNGWYRVLDSHMLARGEVKNIYILGMGQLLRLELHFLSWKLIMTRNILIL
ncbi:hypothetical protein GOODEAATRI_023545, partial [Goodea atripinnis]